MALNDRTPGTKVSGILKKIRKYCGSNKINSNIKFITIFSNNTYNNTKLDNAIAIKSGDTVAAIKSIQIIDNWMHVTNDGDKMAFTCPNELEVITN